MKTTPRLSNLYAAAVGAALSIGASARVRAEPPVGEAAAPLIGAPVAGGLTAAQVAARAAATSRDVQARAQDTAAALAAVDQARDAYLPRLSGVARYTRLSRIPDQTVGNIVVAPPGVPPGPVTAGTPLAVAPLTFPTIVNQYVTQATLQIPLSDYVARLPALQRAAEKSARAARLLEDAARLQVAADARVAYYDWARARLQVGVAERSLAQAQGHLEDVGAALASGAASKADVLRVESQVAAAELALTRASAGSRVLERRLRVITHDEGRGAYEIGEDLRDATAPARATEAVGHDLLLAEALRRRLEPKALVESADALRDQAASTRAAALPRLDAVGNASYARPNVRIFPLKDEFRGTWDAGVQVSWAPTDVFGLEAGRRGQLARAHRTDAEREQLTDSISIEIDRAVQGLREAETAIVTSARGLAAAEESHRVRRSLFLNGRATSVELTDAETELARAQMEAVAARLDRRIAEVRLTHALGRDVAGN